MPLISIIVPVYKVKEEYLRHCIDSLINQTFKDIEIILVDDGTPDNGGVICDEYAQKDPRIKVIHQENQGVSAARNAGMEIATGEWITFVDADDWIELDTCEILKEKIMKWNVDFLIFGLYVNFPNKEIANPFWEKSEHYLDRNEIEELQIQIFHRMRSKFIPPYNTIGVAVCKLYRTSFLEKFNLRFNTDLSLSEDGIFVLQALEYATKVVYVDKLLYHYRKHGDSATYRYRVNAKIDYTKGLKEFEKLLIKFDKDENFYNAYYFRVILNIYAICNQLYCNKKYKAPMLEKIKKIKILCNSEPYITALRKISIKQYFNNSGYFDKIRFILLKLKIYTLFYWCCIIINSYIKKKKELKKLLLLR